MKTPYDIPQKEKESILLKELNKLTKLHSENCPEYAKLLHLFYENQVEAKSLNTIPYLPVNLFKTHNLLSVSQDKIFKVLKSSGTTSIKPSKIFLDASTATRQSAALVAIMTHFLGNERLPMLILDKPNVITDRESYSARGAAILGMMSFGRDFCYAFDENMQLNKEAILVWLKKHETKKLLLFGMTYIVWKYFLSVMEPLHLTNGVLIHTGGWKKMEEEAVTNALFKEKLFQITGITECHNFYGMVEQVGSVFVECEKGYLHAPFTSDVIVRETKTWKETDGIGVIQVLSTLPTSYPGHSLLTEDLSLIKGVDDCACGRKGKYFEVLGRVPKAEIRGCSDTFTGRAL